MGVRFISASARVRQAVRSYRLARHELAEALRAEYGDTAIVVGKDVFSATGRGGTLESSRVLVHRNPNPAPSQPE